MGSTAELSVRQGRARTQANRGTGLEAGAFAEPQRESFVDTRLTELEDLLAPFSGLVGVHLAWFAVHP
jgi:hypothetical protein